MKEKDNSGEEPLQHNTPFDYLYQSTCRSLIQFCYLFFIIYPNSKQKA